MIADDDIDAPLFRVLGVVLIVMEKDENVLFCRHRVFPSAITGYVSFHNLLCLLLSTDAGYGG